MMQQIYKLKQKFANDQHFSEMARLSAYSFGMRILGLLLNYFFLFFVTKYYGARGWGIFAICFAMLQITAMIGSLGVNIGFVKIIPQGYSNIKQLYYDVLKIIIPFNVVISIIIYFGADIIADFFDKDGIQITNYIRISALGILPFSISMINSGLFRGNKEIVRFSFYDSLGRFLWGGLCVIIIHFFSAEVYTVITGFVAGLYILSFISFKGVNKILNRNFQGNVEKPSESFSVKQLLKLSGPLFWANFITQGIMWTTTIILGIYLSKEQVGMFDACNRLASLITIILFAINSISAPKFAEAKDDKKTLKKHVASSSKLIFFTTIPLFFSLLIAGPFVLSLLKYDSSVNNQENLFIIFLIILLGQVVNNISGSVGMLMQMTGHHVMNRNISLASLIFTTIMLFIFTPFYGLIGAAAVVGLNMALKNIFSSLLIYSKTGITTIYNPLQRKKY